MRLYKKQKRKIIGYRVRIFRTLQKMSQADVAKTIQISQSAVSKIEAGLLELSLYEGLLLAQKFRIPVEHLTLEDDPISVDSKKLYKRLSRWVPAELLMPTFEVT